MPECLARIALTHATLTRIGRLPSCPPPSPTGDEWHDHGRHTDPQQQQEARRSDRRTRRPLLHPEQGLYAERIGVGQRAEDYRQRRHRRVLLDGICMLVDGASCWNGAAARCGRVRVR